MIAESKRKRALLNWRLCLQTSGISAILPSQADNRNQNRRVGGSHHLPPWSGPEVSAQVASLQSLILCSGHAQFRTE